MKTRREETKSQPRIAQIARIGGRFYRKSSAVSVLSAVPLCTFLCLFVAEIAFCLVGGKRPREGAKRHEKMGVNRGWRGLGLIGSRVAVRHPLHPLNLRSFFKFFRAAMVCTGRSKKWHLFPEGDFEDFKRGLLNVARELMEGCSQLVFGTFLLLGRDLFPSLEAVRKFLEMRFNDLNRQPR